MNEENRRLARGMVVGLIMVAAMYTFGLVMLNKARGWAEEGRDWLFVERVLANAGVFCASYWWLMAPTLVALCVAAAALWPYVRSQLAGRGSRATGRAS